MKSGVLRGVSIGFDPMETEPLDPKKPRGGQRITKSELLEISFVSVPADTGAGVVARWFGTRAEMLAAFHALPAIPGAAIQRAAARLPSRRSGPILDHANHVWLLQQAERERQRQYSYEARQADLRRWLQHALKRQGAERAGSIIAPRKVERRRHRRGSGLLSSPARKPKIAALADEGSGEYRW